MAELDTGGGGKHKGGKKKGKKLSTRVDFTPMVDLGFLLITFFMLTTSMNKPKTMDISMPDKKTEDTQKIKESQAITLLVTNNDKVVYYFMKDGEPEPPLVTDFSKNGIRATLLKENGIRNPKLDSVTIYKEQFANRKIDEQTYKSHIASIKSYKDALIVVIKATDKSKYKNMIDILDEMLICNIGRYAIVDITQKELEILKTVNLE